MLHQRPMMVSQDGLELAATFHEALDVAGPAPGVLLCHGIRSNRGEAGDLFVQISRALAREGICSLRFDFRGAGESPESEEAFTPDTMQSDAAAAFRTLAAQPEVDAARIGLLGLGLGAAAAVRLAATGISIRCLALLSPLSTGEPLAGLAAPGGSSHFLSFRGSGAPPAPPPPFVRFWMETDLEPAYSSVRAPALLIHGNRDELVPIGHSHEIRALLERAGNRVKLVSIEGCDHGFGHPDWRRLIAREVSFWFQKTL
ncbi:MAG: alpha/beta fold hydrolase [Planctomycetes bacterium]|nr:alpha/beta fold hydrolase [Planctomycetota bacterium]